MPRLDVVSAQLAAPILRWTLGCDVESKGLREARCFEKSSA